MTYSNYKTRGKDLLQYVKAFQATNGFSPSGDDIATHLGVARSYAYRLLDRMEEEGLIERQRVGVRPIGRNIKLTKAAMKTLREEMR